MRTATLTLVAYLACTIIGAFWRQLPVDFLLDAVPDLGALTAAYLGLTARRNVAPAVGGSVVLGYLVDVISGSPAGLAALTLGLTCLVARAAQQRIFVRGVGMTMAFSAFIAVTAGVIGLIVRIVYTVPRPSLATDLQSIALVTIVTALIGPLVWRAFRRIDAAFARTHRERDAALEGLVP